MTDVRKLLPAPRLAGPYCISPEKYIIEQNDIAKIRLYMSKLTLLKVLVTIEILKKL